MQIRDTRLAALATAAGLWMCFVAPTQAACDGTNCAKAGNKTAISTASATGSKPVVLSKFSKRKSYASRKPRAAHARNAEKKSGADEKNASAIPQGYEAKANKKLPSWFLNAQAAIPQTPLQAPDDDQARNIAAADDHETVTMDGVQIASAEQLNDIDRAVVDDISEVKSDSSAATAPAPAAPQGRILRPVSSGEQHVLSNTDGDPWSKTSLIGKIFIAFGSLLTVASAARMLIA